MRLILAPALRLVRCCCTIQVGGAATATVCACQQRRASHGAGAASGPAVDGVPPVAASLASRDCTHGDFSITRFVGWHPVCPEMLVMRRAGNTSQLFLLTDPMGKPHQLTRGRDPVRDALFEPRRGDYILFTRDSAGDEATQLYRLDPKTLAETPLTPAGEFYSPGPWNSAQDKMIVASRPLDRNGRRAQAVVDIYAIDPMQPEARFKLASLAGAGWRVLRWLDRENRLILSEVASGTRAKLWSLDMATGKRSELTDYENGDENASDRWLYRKRFDGDFARLSPGGRTQRRPAVDHPRFRL